MTTLIVNNLTPAAVAESTQALVEDEFAVADRGEDVRGGDGLGGAGVVSPAEFDGLGCLKHHVYIGRYRGVWEDEPLHTRRIR